MASSSRAWDVRSRVLFERAIRSACESVKSDGNSGRFWAVTHVAGRRKQIADPTRNFTHTVPSRGQFIYFSFGPDRPLLPLRDRATFSAPTEKLSMLCLTRISFGAKRPEDLSNARRACTELLTSYLLC